MGDCQAEEDWVFSVWRHLLSYWGFSVPDALLIDLLVWSKVDEIPMGTVDAFDLGRCQELCGQLAEGFYSGDDAIPPLLAVCNFLCMALRDRARGADAGNSRGGGGAGDLDARSSGRGSLSVRGSAPPSPATRPCPPSEGGAWGWLQQKIRLSPPLLTKNQDSPVQLMSRLSPPLTPKSQHPPGHCQPRLSPPRLLGVGILPSHGSRGFHPSSPPPAEQPEGAGSAPASAVAKTPRVAPPASSLSPMEPVQLYRPCPLSMLAGGAPPQPVSCSRPVFPSFPMAPAQTTTATVPSASVPSLRTGRDSDSDDDRQPVLRQGHATMGEGRQRRAESASTRYLWTLPPCRVTVRPNNPARFWDTVKVQVSEAEDEGLLGVRGGPRFAP
ncbi:unnamed protein product [Coccothraustes coccothraustes]